MAKQDNKPYCKDIKSDLKLKQLFVKLAGKQFQLEFDSAIKVQQIKITPIGSDLVRVDAFIDYKQGMDSKKNRPISAWMTRCTGTLIIRGQTWLQNGQLVVEDFAYHDIPGNGIRVGSEKANIKLIAYVDSRCPHCHRLIEYALDLAAQGKMYIEFRQVAYLEKDHEAVNDTKLYDSKLVNKKSLLADKEYLDMLGGLSNQEDISSGALFEKALKLVQTNTQTAKKILRIRQVPGLLVYDEKTRRYRLAGFWEMNRIMQPSLNQ